MMNSVYDLDAKNQTDWSELRSYGFLFLSSILHSVLFGLTLWISLNTDITKPVREIIEFEISSPSAPAPSLAAPAPAVPSVAQPVAKIPTQPKMATAPTLNDKSEPTIKIPRAAKAPTLRPAPVMKTAARTTAPKITAKAAPQPAKSASAASAAKSAAAAPAKSSVALTNPNSDVEAPPLEDNDFESHLSAPVALSNKKWDESDADSDFEKINRDSQKHLNAVASDLDSESQKALSDSEKQLKKASDDQAKADAKLAAAVSDKKKEREAAQAALAQAVANEQHQQQIARENALAQKRADEAAAKAAAAAQAAEARAAAQARAAEARAAAQRESDARAAAYAAAYGPGSSVEKARRLEDLKQMPGNSKPLYDDDDRLAKRAGKVAFAAYISPEGVPTKVQLLHSSGHRSLDLKTLQTIKKWRFYPGQAGWVEIPVNWDLKGEMQEKPVMLRRKVSQN